jgi:hypothetical protein
MKRNRGAWLGLALAGLMSVTAGCGMMRNRGAVQYGLQPGPMTSSAAGQVSMKETNENNQRMRIHVENLPPPGTLHPSLSTYVVWGQPFGDREREAINLGRIAIDNDREGTLEVVTPYPNMGITITAERYLRPAQPSQFVVLEGQVQGAMR